MTNGCVGTAGVSVGKLFCDGGQWGVLMGAERGVGGQVWRDLRLGCST